MDNRQDGGPSRGRGSYRSRPWARKKQRNVHHSILDGSAARIADCSFQAMTAIDEKNPYRGWKYYFPDEKFKPGSDLANTVAASVSHFERTHSLLAQRELEEHRRLLVEYDALAESAEITGGWPDFAEDLAESPALTFSCLSLALYEVMRRNSQLETNSDLPMVYARIINYRPVVALRSLKASLYGKLVSVRGTVVRVGAARLLCTWMGFACNACGRVQTCAQKDGAYAAPKSACAGDGCQSKSFAPLCSSRVTKTKTSQSLRLQENSGDDQREGGRVPRTIECEVTDDLVDTCAPGDNVTVTGIVKVNNEDVAKRGRAGQNLFTLYIEGISVVNAKGQSGGGRVQGGVGVEFSLKDYYAIQACTYAGIRRQPLG